MRIVILHFRSGPGVRGNGGVTMDAGESAGTDGVSLEMEKRAELLMQMGHEPKIASAYDWADIPIPELEFEAQEVVELMHRLFDPKWKDPVSKERIGEEVRDTARRLQDRIRKSIGSFDPQLIFIHNVFSLPIHPAATMGLADYLTESGLRGAAIHHDVRSEGAYKFTPTCRFARRLLVDYFPPEMPNLRHWAINTFDRDFFRERGIPAGVIHDSLDFDQSLSAGDRSELRTTLRRRWGLRPDDVVLLLSTRIVPNKQAEIAGELCKEMEEMKRPFVGRKLSNGSTLTDNSRVVLVLAGRPERAFGAYRDAVFERYNALSITWKYVGDSVMPRRNETSEQITLYPDSYAVADFALYPTRWEGFGNQFLEIIASHLPVAVYEYPIFGRDIAPHGFDYVSLGKNARRLDASSPLVSLPRERRSEAARRIWEILTDPQEYRKITEHNFSLGSSHFGLPVLRSHLEEVVEWASR